MPRHHISQLFRTKTSFPKRPPKSDFHYKLFEKYQKRDKQLRRLLNQLGQLGLVEVFEGPRSYFEKL
jgi:hypothetical protein